MRANMRGSTPGSLQGSIGRKLRSEATRKVGHVRSVVLVTWECTQLQGVQRRGRLQWQRARSAQRPQWPALKGRCIRTHAARCSRCVGFVWPTQKGAGVCTDSVLLPFTPFPLCCHACLVLLWLTFRPAELHQTGQCQCSSIELTCPRPAASLVRSARQGTSGHPPNPPDPPCLKSGPHLRKHVPSDGQPPNLT